MNKVDQLYDSLSEEQKGNFTREQFFQGVLQLEMEKLRDLGLLNSQSLSPQDIRDLLFNKVSTNYNNLLPDLSHRCLYRYCRNKDIKASHVLPEASLRLIAGKKGKQLNTLYTPVTDINSETLKIKNLGVNKAFRFPGFCQKHENWFDFEKELKFVSDKQLYKQIYRSTCYDQFLQEHFLSQERKLSVFMIEKIRAKTNHVINQHTILEIDLTRFQNQEIKNMLARLRKSIRRTKKLLDEYKAFKTAVWNAAHGKNEQLYLWNAIIPNHVPVALTHCGGINLTNNEKQHRVFGAIILMPTAKGNNLIVCTPDKYKGKINLLLRQFNEPGYLEYFIFRALAGLTDNWLVSPEFWEDHLDTDLKDEILAKRHWKRPD